jgi:hypothetical protein
METTCCPSLCHACAVCLQNNFVYRRSTTVLSVRVSEYDTSSKYVVHSFVSRRSWQAIASDTIPCGRFHPNRLSSHLLRVTCLFSFQIARTDQMRFASSLFFVFDHALDSRRAQHGQLNILTVECIQNNTFASS